MAKAKSLKAKQAQVRKRFLTFQKRDKAIGVRKKKITAQHMAQKKKYRAAFKKRVDKARDISNVQKKKVTAIFDKRVAAAKKISMGQNARNDEVRKNRGAKHNTAYLKLVSTFNAAKARIMA